MERSMNHKRFVAGIDGGGTKTACMLADLEGSVVVCAAAGGSNHQISGLSEAMENVCLSLDLACVQAGITRDQIAFVFLGMAGADVKEDYDLLRGGLGDALGGIPFEVVNDSWIAFSCATNADWGAISICGTGSNLAVKAKNGEVYSVRALRYMLGNYGGGQHLAEMALHHAFRFDEGTGMPTRLADELPGLCGCRSMDELAMRIYQSDYRYPRDFNIPKLVFDLAAEGDAVSLRVIRQMGAEMGEMLGRLITKAGMAEEAVPVVLSGSQYVKDDEGLLRKPLTDSLHAFVPRACVKLAQSPPVYGALMSAFSEVGKRLPDEAQASLRACAEKAFS